MRLETGPELTNSAKYMQHCCEVWNSSLHFIPKSFAQCANLEYCVVTNVCFFSVLISAFLPFILSAFFLCYNFLVKNQSMEFSFSITLIIHKSVQLRYRGTKVSTRSNKWTSGKADEVGYKEVRYWLTKQQIQCQQRQEVQLQWIPDI